MASGSHKYSANEALAFIHSDSNDSFGDESSLDFSNIHDSEEEPCFRGTGVDEIQEKTTAAGTFQKLLFLFFFGTGKSFDVSSLF